MMTPINSKKKSYKCLDVLCGAFDVCRCVLWHCDMEQSHCSSHSFSIILEAVLAYDAVLQNEGGSSSKPGQSWRAGADRCLSTWPVLPAPLCVSDLVPQSLCGHCPAAFRVGLCSTLRLFGTCACRVTIPLCHCLLPVPLPCALRSFWLLSPVKAAHPFGDGGIPFPD